MSEITFEDACRDDCLDRMVPSDLRQLVAERDRLRALINTPETADFVKAVQIEAAHQRERFGEAHDAMKNGNDWIFLVGYLLGKCDQAFKDGNHEKALHHCVSSAAVIANRHRHLLTTSPLDLKPVSLHEAIDRG